MSDLILRAGPTALERLREEGLKPSLFKALVGASGGPKWFVLYGLDRYLFGEFLAGSGGPLATIGSSAGAWRLACLATADPVAALDRLAGLYSTERYSPDPSPAEVSDNARKMLHGVLGPAGARELVENPRIATHIVANRCRGVLSRGGRKTLAAGLAAAAASNVLSRRLLGLYLERVVFKSHEDECLFESLTDLPTQGVRLTQANVYDALIASGSIPLALEGVQDIEGARPGLYVDGGITDYHFDLPFSAREGLVLYPHFYPWLVPGWFDKHLPWRTVNPRHYDNTLLLAPSPEFVESLPYGKIPDRRDFLNLAYDERVRYWQTVLDRSRCLADEFATLVENGMAPERIQPFSARRGR